MNNQTNILETDTILNSIYKKGAIVLNMFNNKYKKFLNNILILESLNIKNKAVLVFTLNQKKEDLINNLICTKAGVSIVKRNLLEGDWIKIAYATSEFSDPSICITDDCRTVDDIVHAVCNYIKNNLKEINFVLIDNLWKIESDIDFDIIVKDLNIFAKYNNLSLIILK